MKNVINFNSHQQKKKEPINNETQLKLLNTICYELRCKIDKTIQLEINEMCSEYEIKQNDFIREVYSFWVINKTL